MVEIESFFPTRIYRAELEDGGLVAELDAACRSIAEDDRAGQRWSQKHGYPGYTSYASLDDLPWRAPVFADLVRRLDRHVAAFAKDARVRSQARQAEARFDLDQRPAAGRRARRAHPSALGRQRHLLRRGAGGRERDQVRGPAPRLHDGGAAEKAEGGAQNRQFVSIAPRPGTVLLWESWLRHEVPLNEAEDDRISVSFNYRWR